jgi:hypothetical protein
MYSEAPTYSNAEEYLEQTTFNNSLMLPAQFNNQITWNT